jgi:hypothetical protein
MFGSRDCLSVNRAALVTVSSATVSRPFLKIPMMRDEI